MHACAPAGWRIAAVAAKACRHGVVHSDGIAIATHEDARATLPAVAAFAVTLSTHAAGAARYPGVEGNAGAVGCQVQPGAAASPAAAVALHASPAPAALSTHEGVRELRAGGAYRAVGADVQPGAAAPTAPATAVGQHLAARAAGVAMCRGAVGQGAVLRAVGTATTTTTAVAWPAYRNGMAIGARAAGTAGGVRGLRHHVGYAARAAIQAARDARMPVAVAVAPATLARQACRTAGAGVAGDVVAAISAAPAALAAPAAAARAAIGSAATRAACPGGWRGAGQGAAQGEGACACRLHGWFTRNAQPLR